MTSHPPDNLPPTEHAWIHEHLATALTGGLTPEEQSRFDTHIHNCPDCFDAFTEARDADRTLLRTLDPLIPDADFENRLITNFREKEMKTHWHPFAKRAGFAIAAAVALAATGVGAQYVTRDNILNNPLSEHLVAQSDSLGIVNPVSAFFDHLSFGPMSDAKPAAALAAPKDGRLTAGYRLGVGAKNDRDREIENLEQKNEIENLEPKNATLEAKNAELNRTDNELRTSQRFAEQSIRKLQEQIAASGKDENGARDTGGTLNINGANMYRGELTKRGAQEERLGDARSMPADKLDAGISVGGSARRSLEARAEPTEVARKRLAGDSTVHSFGVDRAAGQKAGEVALNYFSPGQQLADAEGKQRAFGGFAAGTGINAGNTPVAAASPAAAPTLAEASSSSSSQIGGAGGEFKNGQVSHQVVLGGVAGPVDAPGPAGTQPSPTTPSVGSAEISERKIIRNGTVEFEVRSFDDAFATVSSVVHEEGGFISSTSSDKLANGKVRGSITLRVPPEHLDRLLLKLRALGDLKSQQIGDTDITKEYTDLDSELRALRAMESRLIDIIKTGNGAVKDLVAAEKQLGEYRVRIEKIEGEIRYYNNLVSMATLTVTAYEKDIQTPTAAQEQENVSLNVETEDVEAKYADARKIIDDAKGRIIDSELKKHDAGQFAATITAEVPPDKADFVAAQLKQLGTVAAFNRDRKQTTTGGNGTPTPGVEVEQKPTRFTIALYNLANIAPRETAVLTIAVPNVEAAYTQVIDDVRRTPDAKDAPQKPVGRIVTSSINGQQPEQMSADIRADITANQADAVLASIRNLGEVMNSSLSENPDTANVTSAKRGLQLRIVSTASVPPRESRTLTLVAQAVPESYNKLIAALQSLEANGNARILTSQLNQSDPRTINATLAFDVKRDSLPAVDKAFADAGIDTLSRNISRSNDTANTLDSKVHFQIDQLQSADALPPRRTTTLGIETDNVEHAIDTLRTQLQKDGISHIQYNISKESSGRITAHLIADIPVATTMTVLNQIHDIGGTEKVNQVIEDPQVPDTRFARERIDLTLTSREALVASNQGILATTRAALASAAAALLWSLYLILTGLLFLGPWLLLGWVVWKMSKRRKAAA
ncbi:MAG: DUF4349 domain-containing protein [Phycisphaerae bacterium]